MRAERCTCWYAWKQTPARSACLITKSGFATPKDFKPAGVKVTPSFKRATGASRKKDKIVMMENRLMLSSPPYKKSCTHHQYSSPYALHFTKFPLSTVNWTVLEAG
jgi:hypothetical protein